MKALSAHRKVFDELVAKYGDERDKPSSHVFCEFSRMCWEGPLRNKDVLWSNGSLFLAASAAIADEVANWFDELGFCACTGYYDPEEDVRNGCVDECTGFHYVDI